MKCFIHMDTEAVSVCKHCGKAMCINCSSYSQHNGICPECKLDEYIEERNELYDALQKNKSSIIKSSVFAVLLAVIAVFLGVKVTVYCYALLVGTLAFAIRIAVLVVRRKPINERVEFLTDEIDKLTLALQKGSRSI